MPEEKVYYARRQSTFTDLQDDKNKDINMAEYYFFRKSFNDEEIAEIVKLAEKYPKETAGTGQGKNAITGKDEVRKSSVRWLHNFPEWVYERLFECVNEANDALWDFSLTCANEVIQYTEYPPDGGHYDWHMDCGHGIQQKRKISITVQLNDDYDGGELEIWRGQKPVQALKKKGTVVVFPSYMMHRVAPVTKGTRNSLVLWIGGEHYR